MASLGSIPRRIQATPHPFCSRLTPSLRHPSFLHARHASSSPSAAPKPLSAQFARRQQPVIPQPDKYRPPSHGARTPRSETAQRSYGPPLSAEDKERMQKKKYPNMMSPKGTFSYWFFNSRGLHLFISLGILFSLTGAVIYMDFMHKTIYASLMPSKKDFLWHPIDSFFRAAEVYQMHVLQQTEVINAKVDKKLEDIEKRREYRKMRIKEAEARGEEYVEDTRYYVGEDGIRRRRVKRWFGIWE